jgi:purine-nucleoside phosphorylase
MTTPHNHAKPGDYAEAVLLPGDPLRAKWIAETFLRRRAKQVNSVRNCFGFTGTWKGKPVSVQATRAWASRRCRSTCTSSSTVYRRARR